MNRKPIFFVSAIILMVLLTGCSDKPVQYGALSGTVVDQTSGLKLWDGEATIAGQTVQIVDGQFEIKNIPAGAHTLKVSKDHYRDQTVQVHVGNKRNVVEVRMHPSYTAKDLDLFARLVNAESRGEVYEGQVAVAASVLNRVEHPNYPNSLRGVVTHRTGRYAQYSPLDDGSINRPASISAKNAVRDALAGWDPSQGATGFFAPAKVRNRSNWVWSQATTRQVGNHRFFLGQKD